MFKTHNLCSIRTSSKLKYKQQRIFSIFNLFYLKGVVFVIVCILLSKCSFLMVIPIFVVCLYRVNVWRCVFYQIFFVCLIGVNEDSSLDQATQYETFQSGFISYFLKNKNFKEFKNFCLFFESLKIFKNY